MKYKIFSMLSFVSVSMFSMENYNASVAQVKDHSIPRIPTFSSMPSPIANKRDIINELVNDIKDAQIAEIDINKIHNKIDEDHLGITKDTYFKKIVGSYRSFYKSYYLSNDQVKDEIERIESYIPGNNKELVLEKLEQQHWYVNYLLQASLQSKIKEIENVKGSNIDLLYNPSNQAGFKRMVHLRALQKYFNDSRIKRSLFNGVPMGKLGDIHWAVLYGHQKGINSRVFHMSSDGKYLRSMSNDQSEIIIWDMEQGLKTNLSGQENIFAELEWTQSEYAGFSRFCVVDKTDNYFAEVFTPEVRTGPNNPPSNMVELYGPRKMPVKIEKNEPAIILFTRPQELSYFCQEAFYKNKNNLQELVDLQHSKSFDDIKGYPKNNLEQRIRERIKELELSSKL